MLAPRRPNTPVLVLDRHLTRRSNFTASDERNGKGREGLVGEDGGRGGQPGEVLRGINGIASSAGQEQTRSTLAVLSISQTPPSQTPPSQTICTVSIQATLSATLIPEGGARVEIEALPGQNQNQPNLDDAKIQPQTLPGINQDTSKMGEVPKPAFSVAAATLTASGAPVITVNRPLPGQNQANPILGELAPPPAPTPPAPVLPALQSPPPPPIDNPTSTPSLLNEPSMPSMQATKTSVVFTSSMSSASNSIIISSSPFALSPVTSFVTITRSGQGKEESPVTLALSSRLLSSASMNSVGSTENATPQAIAVAQSFSDVLSTTTAIATATLTPTAVSSTQEGSLLHPTARTLLILFVILGALAILIAIVILMMIRSHRKRSRAQQQAMMNQNPYDASSDRTGVTTHISASSNDNPFLTASEKAIVERAAPPNSAADANNSSSFSDAISSFIKKSRRLTYKISP